MCCVKDQVNWNQRTICLPLNIYYLNVHFDSYAVSVLNCLVQVLSKCTFRQSILGGKILYFNYNYNRPKWEILLVILSGRLKELEAGFVGSKIIKKTSTLHTALRFAPNKNYKFFNLKTV